jgi:hypothetical protein
VESLEGGTLTSNVQFGMTEADSAEKRGAVRIRSKSRLRM